jgi:hypothetical protein
VIDGLADLRAHRHHLCRCRVRFGEHDLERGGDDGQRCAQLMAACEDDVALANRIGDGLRDAGWSTWSTTALRRRRAAWIVDGSATPVRRIVLTVKTLPSPSRPPAQAFPVRRLRRAAAGSR